MCAKPNSAENVHFNETTAVLFELRASKFMDRKFSRLTNAQNVERVPLGNLETENNQFTSEYSMSNNLVPWCNAADTIMYTRHL